MKILFVCKHNRFRSKVAEAIFNKLNMDKNIEVKSAGVALDLMRPYIADNVIKIMKEKGIKMEDKQARWVNEMNLKWADRIIIVANNISPDIFKGKARNIEIWKIPDADESEEGKIRKIINDIEKRVKKLIASINE